jgi:hypothetical protein
MYNRWSGKQWGVWGVIALTGSFLVAAAQPGMTAAVALGFISGAIGCVIAELVGR